jgi:hypothetical protein
MITKKLSLKFYIELKKIAVKLTIPRWVDIKKVCAKEPCCKPKLRRNKYYLILSYLS